MNGRGDALAVWTQAGSVQARIRIGGGRLRATQRVGRTVPGSDIAPSAALSTHRAELVGWVGQRVDEAVPAAGRATVAQARDGSAFTATPLSDLPAAGIGHYVSEAGVRVAYDAGGRALVAYTAFDPPASSGRFSVRTAELRGAANNPRQALTDVQTVSDPATDAVLSDLVVGPAGGELVVVLSGVQGTDPAPGGPGVTVQSASRARAPRAPSRGRS